MDIRTRQKTWRFVGIVALSILAGTIFWAFREKFAVFCFNTQTAGILTDLRNRRKIEIESFEYSGTEKEGMYLVGSRRIVTHLNPIISWTRKQPKFMWCVPPPSGDELRIADREHHDRYGDLRPIFYACTIDLIDGKRYFVFLGTIETTDSGWRKFYGWLRDDEVSWYYQSLIKDLNADELVIENQYREQCGHRFPVVESAE